MLCVRNILTKQQIDAECFLLYPWYNDFNDIIGMICTVPSNICGVIIFSKLLSYVHFCDSVTSNVMFRIGVASRCLLCSG